MFLNKFLRILIECSFIYIWVLVVNIGKAGLSYRKTGDKAIKGSHPALNMYSEQNNNYCKEVGLKSK